jgi:hypothetical protein
MIRMLFVLFAFMGSSKAFGIASEIKHACVLPCGGIYASTTYSSYETDHFWNASGDKRNAFNDCALTEWTLHTAYGLTKRDTLSVRCAWGRVEESLNGRVFGFEDVEIGWKHYIGSMRGFLITTEIIGIIPVANGYKPGLRYGKYGGEINLLASKGFSLCNILGGHDLRIGYRAYQGFPSDQIRADYSLTVRPFKQVTIANSLQLEYGVWNGKQRIDACNFLLNPNYRLLRYRLEGRFQFLRWISLFAGYQYHIWGRNVGTEGGFFGGGSLQF